MQKKQTHLWQDEEYDHVVIQKTIEEVLPMRVKNPIQLFIANGEQHSFHAAFLLFFCR